MTSINATLKYGSTNIGSTYYLSNTSFAANTWFNVPVKSGNPTSFSVNTSTLFNTNNRTTRTVTLSVTVTRIQLEQDGPEVSYSSGYFSNTATNWGNVLNVTLNAPPAVTASNMRFTKNYRRSDGSVYRGYTSVSVDVSGLSAQYGGTISSVVFSVANKSVSGTSNGTYTIVLDENTTLGTYTPTVTVTDSRGQVTTKSLTAFTILAYSAPTITDRAVVRTDSSGTPADEGTYALMTATINWLDFLEALKKPTTTYVDENGQTHTASVTWYTDRALQYQVQDWTALTSPVTVYGITGGLSYQFAYPITVTPEDTRAVGTPATVVLPPAFYTMDFKAGGHGIAIGAPATEDELFIAMDMELAMDHEFYLELDTDASSGTDYELYQAIVSLGWTDVLVN